MEEQPDYKILFYSLLKNFDIKDLPKEIFQNKKHFIELVRCNPDTFEYASDELKNDKEFVLEAVHINGSLLHYVSDELRNDKEVALIAVQTYADALEFVSDELKNDKDVVFEAIKRDGSVLEYASDDLKRDKEIIYHLIKNNLSLNYIILNECIAYGYTVYSDNYSSSFTKKALLNYLGIFVEPAKFPFNNIIYPDCKYN